MTSRITIELTSNRILATEITLAHHLDAKQSGTRLPFDEREPAQWFV